jgi:hypothetical protein
MAKTYDLITDELQGWIKKQHLFFVASAPLTGTGHVNLSPKGQDCFRILSPHQAGYLDMTGSGNETSAHLQENGRITIMFCAFDGPPRILRLFGKGRTILPDSAEWQELAPDFNVKLGTRQIILVDVTRVQTSCGYGVPLYDYVGERDTMDKWCESKGEEGLETYRQKNNFRSIDALPTPLALNVETGD